MIWKNTSIGDLPLKNFTPNFAENPKAKKESPDTATEELFIQEMSSVVNKTKYSLTHQAYVEIYETCEDGTLRCKNLSELYANSQPIQLNAEELTDKIKVLLLIQDSKEDQFVQIEVSIQHKINECLLQIAKVLQNVEGVIFHNGSVVKKDQSFSERKVFMNDKFIMIGFENSAKPQGFCESLGGGLWCALGKSGNHLVPGYLTQDGKCIFELYGSNTVDDFEIYKGQKLVKSQEGYQAQGYEESTMPLFCAIANTQWGRIPGKVHRNQNVCYYAYEGRGHSTHDFDLVVNEE